MLSVIFWQVETNPGLITYIKRSLNPSLCVGHIACELSFPADDNELSRLKEKYPFIEFQTSEEPYQIGEDETSGNIKIGYRQVAKVYFSFWPDELLSQKKFQLHMPDLDELREGGYAGDFDTNSDEATRETLIENPETVILDTSKKVENLQSDRQQFEIPTQWDDTPANSGSEVFGLSNDAMLAAINDYMNDLNNESQTKYRYSFLKQNCSDSVMSVIQAGVRGVENKEQRDSYQKDIAKYRMAGFFTTPNSVRKALLKLQHQILSIPAPAEKSMGRVIREFLLNIIKWALGHNPKVEVQKEQDVAPEQENSSNMRK